MNSTKNRLLDYFIKKMLELYEVTENQSRFLFDRWNIIDKNDESSIKTFIESDDVRKVFFIQPEINIAKEYTLDDLKKIGIELKELDKEKHIYNDYKYNLLWEEVYHGMADCWSGHYKVKKPVPDDKHLL